MQAAEPEILKAGRSGRSVRGAVRRFFAVFPALLCASLVLAACGQSTAGPSSPIGSVKPSVSVGGPAASSALASTPAPASAAAASKPAEPAAAKTSAGGAATSAGVCAYLATADASTALAKPAMNGVAEGSEHCFFAAADTKQAPAKEYFSLTVRRQASAEDAKLSLQAWAGPRTPQTVDGLGDQAIFKKDTDGGSIYVLKGLTEVLLDLHSAAQTDPLGALTPLASKVVAKI